MTMLSTASKFSIQHIVINGELPTVLETRKTVHQLSSDKALGTDTDLAKVDTAGC